MRVRNQRDLAAGVLFIAFGVLGAVLSLRHPLGTGIRMGPGSFPLLVSLVLAVLGVLTVIRGLLRGEARLERIPGRPVLAVSAAVVAFALLVRPLGLVLSTIVLVGLVGLGRREIRLHEAALLALSLAAFTSAVFAWGLGLPVPVWPW